MKNMLPLYSKEELNSIDFGLAGKTAIITGETAGIAILGKAER